MLRSSAEDSKKSGLRTACAAAVWRRRTSCSVRKKATRGERTGGGAVGSHAQHCEHVSLGAEVASRGKLLCRGPQYNERPASLGPQGC